MLWFLLKKICSKHTDEDKAKVKAIPDRVTWKYVNPVIAVITVTIIKYNQIYIYIYIYYNNNIYDIIYIILILIISDDKIKMEIFFLLTNFF